MGKVLAGRYELLKQIAVGGMATVHLSRALGVGGFERLVAIKVMHAHIGAEPDFVTMFLDEARLAARIRHPNVVPTLDVQESPDGLFLVMEYIEGPSLHQLIKATAAGPTGAGTGIPLPVVLRMTIDTLSGLHDAHELTDDEGHPLSLVHRDVSPANVLIGTDGVARITDFGVARAEARLSSTRGGQLKGKIPYMPPEQLMSEQIDRRCDVYAAGAMLWETLVGRRLFQADSDGALLQKILAGPEASPAQLKPHVPAAIDAVCMQALARDKNARFATAADFADALERAAQASGVTIASARAVAAFVEQSGAYRKLGAKEIAALKSGAAVETSASRTSAAQPISKPAPEPNDPPKSTPTASSQVTSAGSALSARVEPQKPRRIGLYAGVVAVLLALGAVALVMRPKNDTASSTAGSATVATSAREEPRAAASSAAPPPASEAVASASSVPSATSASSTPSASPVVVPTARPPVVRDVKPPPEKAKPLPTSYSPDRL